MNVTATLTALSSCSQNCNIFYEENTESPAWWKFLLFFDIPESVMGLWGSLD